MRTDANGMQLRLRFVKWDGTWGGKRTAANSLAKVEALDAVSVPPGRC